MVQKYGVKEVCDATFYALGGKNKGKPVIFLDTLKTSGLETKASDVAAKGGKGNAKLVEWNHSKEASMKLQDALMSMKTLAMLNGADIKAGDATIYKTEVFTLETAAKTQEGIPAMYEVTLSETPLGEVHALDAHGNDLLATVEGKKVVVGSLDGVDAGSEIRVFYQFKKASGAEKITVSASKFPGYYRVIGDTVIRNADTGEDEAFQIVIYKTKLKSDLKMEFKADGEPSVFDLTLEVFADGNGNMIEYIKY
ncbi:hypothetical protein [Bacillus thuringiensis]|uniref:hypothetical protein n=1 Tax=Bacillus thuringiensis TaxID=1428 RepID=UPI000BF5136F|nr:hypothetical protein [Bacillus thuringiensis]MDO6628705.1 hypothetical protein [Bacillus thuringiensis]MDO6659170.1 hypothetical protein [Bacillus thuringiensis]MDO6698752.1 hypothetical protein [Bacillus thuringiensis]PES54506.1 hypothetical protein CN506_20760 [Bacillus thuringiensis]